MADQLRRWKLTKGHVRHGSGLNNARRDTGHLGCGVGGVPGPQVGTTVAEAVRSSGPDTGAVLQEGEGGPRGTDQRRGRVVLADEHRTSRVSSAVNGQQHCERQLNKRRATRPADWKLPAGQVEQGLPSLNKRTKAEPAAEPTKGKGKAAKAKPAPQPGRWVYRDCNAAPNMQHIGESKWRPLELCYWPEQGKLPAKGKEYSGLGYKRLRDKPPKAQHQQPAEAQKLKRERDLGLKWAEQKLRLYSAQSHGSGTVLEWFVINVGCVLQWGTRKRLVMFSAGAGVFVGIGARGKVVTVGKFRTSRVSSSTSSPQPCGRRLKRGKPTRLQAGSPQQIRYRDRLLGPCDVPEKELQAPRLPSTLRSCVIEHMMRAPHHPGIRLLPGEVAVFEQPSSAWPVAMLQQLDEVHLRGDLNSLNANATTIITSIQEFYRHPGRFINKWGKAMGVVGCGFSREVKKRFPQLVLGRLDYSQPDPKHKWRLPANSVLRQPWWKEERIGESKQRPLELCSYEGLKALPPIGKEYQQGYKRVNDRLPKARQRLHRAAEYRRGIDGRARNNNAWLDRDTNPCLNFQRIGESMQRPLELCSWTDREALPPIGKEYQQGYKRVNDRLPKARQRLHRAAEYRRGTPSQAQDPHAQEPPPPPAQAPPPPAQGPPSSAQEPRAPHGPASPDPTHSSCTWPSATTLGPPIGQVAASLGHTSMVDLLLRLGSAAVINEASKGLAMTPLMLASVGGHAPVISRLLKAGADMAPLDANGWTALHHAAFKGHADVCRHLLGQQDVDVDVLSSKAETPLALAVLMRNDAASLVLLEHGAQTSYLRTERDKQYLEDTQKKEAARKAQEEQDRQAAQRKQEELLRKQEHEAALRRMAVEKEQDAEVIDINEDTDINPDSPDSGPGADKPTPATSPAWAQVHSPGAGVVTLPGPQRRAHPMYVQYRPGTGLSALPSTESFRASGNWGQMGSPRVAAPGSARRSHAGSVSMAGTRPGSPAGSPGIMTGRVRPSQSAVQRSHNGDLRSSRSPSTAGDPPPPTAAHTSAATPAANTSWVLHAFAYKGITDGLLLDKDSCIVFFLDPQAQTRLADSPHHHDEDGGLAAHKAGHAAAKPTLPQIVGKLVPGVGGIDAPAYGRIVPLTVNDVGTLERSKPALRCLHRAAPEAARLLQRAALRCVTVEDEKESMAMSGKALPDDPPLLAADLAPDLGSLPWARGVSLVVPLCGVLGVRDVAELAQLTEKDLVAADVDPAFLPDIITEATTRPNATPVSSPNDPQGLQGSAQSDSSEAAGTELASLAQLLLNHGLVKLLPLAAELKLLGPLEVHRWHELASASASVPMSRLELARLRNLLSAIKAAQHAALKLQASRMELLLRLTVGSLVLYEADPDRAVLRGERLVGLVLDDCGSKAAEGGKQYKVRDLLDDSLVWLAPGQLRRTTLVEAMQYLRADLLPPTTPGAPVTPRCAFPGLLVQLALWPGSLGPAEQQAGTGGSDLTPSRAMQQVVGSLKKPATNDGSAWEVQWPDGVVRIHNIGGDGSFELVHLQVSLHSAINIHRLAGAPLAESHFESLLQQQPCLPCTHKLWQQVCRIPCGPARLAPYCVCVFASQGKLCLPVVRSPLWSLSTTDDAVPGTPGVCFLDAVEPRVARVLWSRSRSAETSTYCSDSASHQPLKGFAAQGLFPLCHGLLGSTPVTMYNAKTGVLVEPGPAGMVALSTAAATGPGMLVAPVRLAPHTDAVVWRVKWPTGSITEHELGLSFTDSELLVSDAYMAPNDSRLALLNEVSKKSAGVKGGAAAVAVAAGPLAAASALSKSERTAGAAAAASAGRLGRPLFCRNAAQGSNAGMLGMLVKLNLGAVALQPGCEQGPMVAHEPIPLSAVLAARKEGNPLGPTPRDDVGWVVRDMGPGAWRGLLVGRLHNAAPNPSLRHASVAACGPTLCVSGLTCLQVRKLGSTEGFWYDEAVLLPASQDDVAKQVARRGASYVPPRHLQGVPVTDANAGPGMLVQRAYAPGTILDGSDKATQVGELKRMVSPGHWEVRWADGHTNVYRTGARNRFQLCFVNHHETAGSPLMAATVDSLTTAGVKHIPVIDGPHVVAGGMPPGTVRYVADPETEQGLKQHEVALLGAAGMVATSAGERRFAGGLLQMYELSHAIVPGNCPNIYTAKRGMRVTLKERPVSAAVRGGARAARGDGMAESGASAKAAVKLGTLVAPARLAVRAVLDAGSGAGSGARGGPTASREPVLVLDSSRVLWTVQWDNGRAEEVAVGTCAAHTPLKVALRRDMSKGDKGQEEEDEEAGEAEVEQVVPGAAKPEQLLLRKVEELKLAPTGALETDDQLKQLIETHQTAVQSIDHLVDRLCDVWANFQQLLLGQPLDADLPISLDGLAPITVPDELLQASREKPVRQQPWQQLLPLPDDSMASGDGDVEEVDVEAVRERMQHLLALRHGQSMTAPPSSMDVFHGLMHVLKVVHAKAKASVAADAAVRRAKSAEELQAKGREVIEAKREDASELKPFDYQSATGLLAEVWTALTQLRDAEAAAADALEFAEQAVTAPSMAEDVDMEQAKKAREESEAAASHAAEAQHRMFPAAIDAIKASVTNMTDTMRSKLLDSEALHAAVHLASKHSMEARKASDAAEKACKAAEEELVMARDNTTRKEQELDKAKSAVNTCIKQLEAVEEEVKQAQASIPDVKDSSAPSKVANERLVGAETSRTDAVERLEKVRAAMAFAAEELERSKAAEQAAYTSLKDKQQHASALAKVYSTALAAEKVASRAARTLDPGSEVLEKAGAPSQLEQAAQCAAVSERALGMLQELRAKMPASLRAPMAVARLLGKSCSVVALVGAAAAVEWSRTSCLDMEQFMLDMEADAEAAIQAATMSSTSPSLSGMGGSTIGQGSSRAGGSGGAAVAGYTPKLPDIKRVDELLDRVRSSLLSSLAQYKRLMPLIGSETSLVQRNAAPEAATDLQCISQGDAQPEDEVEAAVDKQPKPVLEDKPRVLNAVVLAQGLERAVLCAAQAMDKLASTAAANVTAAALDAAAAAAAVTVQSSNPSGAADKLAAVAADALPRALRAARVAALAMEAAKLLPAPVDIPVSDTKLATTITALVRSTQNACVAAQKDVAKLVNDAAAKLMKTAVGAAATPASAYFTAYCHLSISAPDPEESQYWATEAQAVWPKARAGVEAALAALAPQPPAPVVLQEEDSKEGLEGEGSKKKEDPAELAAKAAATAKAKQAISSFAAGLAVKLGNAAADWAIKLMESITNSSDIERIPRNISLAAARMEMGVSPTPAAVPTNVASSQVADGQAGVGASHPESVVRVLQGLSSPLAMCDTAFRQAGDHTGLDSVEDSLQSILQVASEAAWTRVNLCLEQLEELEQQLDERGGAPTEEEGLEALGLASCAVAAAQSAAALLPLLPLVLPEEQVDRKLADSAERAEEARERASQLYEAALAAIPSKAVAGAVQAGGQASGLQMRLQVFFVEKGSTDIPAYDLKLAFVPGLQDQVNGLSTEPADSVLCRPKVVGMLMPFTALLEAMNTAVRDIVAAQRAQPSEATISRVLPSLPQSGSASPGMFHGGGIAAGTNPAAVRTNTAQLQRWAPNIANMRASAALVVQGLMHAQAAATEQLETITLPYDV
ncbi:hypothetical protein QJQ45_026184 [Haematococcus lacustris]|nr:hypothetical protein QJQ45_026184 [Haematococcus lacustris]